MSHAAAANRPTSDDRAPSGGCGEVSLHDPALHGGSGDVSVHDRACRAVHSVPEGVRAGFMHGDHRGSDRAFELHGADPHGDRAQHLRRAQLCEDRAQQLFGDLPGLGRAQHIHGDFLKVIGLSTCMVIYLNLIGLCMVVLWRSLGLMVFNKMGVFMVERKGKELWVWLQCRHRGSRLEEEVEEKRS